MRKTSLIAVIAAGFMISLPTYSVADVLENLEYLRDLRGDDNVTHRRSSRSRGAPAPSRYSGGGDVGPRPRKWCGWWMRTQYGGGPEFNVAWNWRKYGRPVQPQVGAIVVWRHHVGIITGRAANGRWIVKSGNDGGRVRERPRSVRGAIFRM